MADALKRIPLASIRENPVALRAVNRQTPEYAEFADSIKQHGVMNPIVVRPIPASDGVELYGLIDGLHRYTASLDAGFADIPAQVKSMDDAEVMEAQLVGNAHKIETRPVEYSKHLQRILSANPMLTLGELAGKLNKSSTWLSERLGILKLSAAIHELVDNGDINLSNAYALAKLPEDEQQNFVDRAISMSPQEFTPTVLARKKEIDTAKRQGRDTKPAEFVPVAHLQKLSDLKAEMENPQVGPALIEKLGITSPQDAFALGIRWTLHMDPESIEAQREKDASRRRQLEEQKTRAAADRARKKADDAATAAAKLAGVS